MSEWYELSEADLAANGEALKAKQLAYYNTFYASDESRAVLADLRRRCNSSGGMEPVAILAIIEFLSYIRASCGIRSEKDVIDAEAETVSFGE